MVEGRLCNLLEHLISAGVAAEGWETAGLGGGEGGGHPDGYRRVYFTN